MSYVYQYDSNGIRLSATASNGTTIDYLYNGTKLLRETDGTDTIWYLYDNTGMVGFELNGTTYYFIRNLQGDVTKLVDTSGNTVVTYTYDSWGKVLSVAGTLASTVGEKNPIRYRGYYYDTETNLYYLNSRYYDPETGRFISTDVVAENGSLYAYCVNDPVNNIDPSGCLSQKWKTRLIKIGIGAALAVAAVAITVATGGAALPVIATIATATVSGAAIGAGVSAVEHRIETGSWEGAGKAALEGAIDGAVNGFLTGSALAFVGATVSALSGIGTGASTVGNAASKTPNMSEYSFSNTAIKHAYTRPYYNSVITQQNIVDTGTKTAETATRFKYIANGSFNGTQGTYEIVIDVSKKIIYHLLFRS